MAKSFSSPLGTNSTESANEALSLREACVLVARDILTHQGWEALSLRDVARRLGVSHQAPYRHFATRDDLLAEVLRQCFAEFAHALAHRAPQADPHDELGGLGDAYLRYAEAHPVEYRLMFSTPWPRAAHHPAMAQAAKVAFDELRGVLGRIYARVPRALQASWVERDAIGIWSAMHGLASIAQLDAHAALGLAPTTQLHAHVFSMIERSLAAASLVDPTADSHAAVLANLRS